MKNLTFKWFGRVFMLLFLYPLIPVYAQCTPPMGAATNFAVFTTIGAISNIGITSIDGDIGSNSGEISGFESSTISGTFYNADSFTQSAAMDLAVAFTAFQNITATNTTHAPAFGSGETILPGVYSIGGAGSIAGVLTLDGQNDPSAKFILKFGGAFTSGASASILLTNGAQPNNIYWIVNGAVSLAANTSMSGTIITNAAISIGVGNFLNCKLFSTDGAISTYETILTINGIDNNSTLYYADADLDGYGNITSSSCYMLAGYVLNHSDCDDTNALIHPNAIEIYGNGIDDNCNGSIDSDTSICGMSTIWNGTEWSNGTPTYEKSVIFSGAYTSTSDIYACAILITNNATLILNHTLFIYDAITIENDSYCIANNNNNIIQINPLATNTGNLMVHRNTSTIVRLDHTLWSSPVSGQNLYAFSPETLTHRFYTYDTLTNTYLSSTLSNASEFLAGKGYAIRAPNNQSANIPAEWTGSFYGVPNNGTIPFNVIHSPSNYFNLLGNPYPSTLDAELFVNDNEATIEGTLYFYEHTLTMDANGIFPTGTNYASWNATGGTAATAVDINHPDYHTPSVIPNGSIQVGQGFFVSAKNNGTVNFTNSQRTNNQDHQFLRTATEKHHIWLNVTSSEGNDINQILIGYVNGATMGLDVNYDGKSYGNIGNHLYSIIGNEKYVIQGRSLPFNATDEVPLGWFCDTPGNYTIKLSDWDGIFLGNQAVYIRDNFTGTTTNIKTTPYIFNATAGTFNDRFVVVYTENLSELSHDLAANSVIIYQKNNRFHVSTPNTIMKDISVYNLSGQLLYQLKNINSNAVILNKMGVSDQVVVFNIILQNLQPIAVKVIHKTP